MIGKQNLAVVLLFLFRVLGSSSQERNFFYSEPQHPQSRTYHPTQNTYVNTRQESFGNPHNNFRALDAFLHNPDLDTSDLPSHLQRTLPQYQIGVRGGDPTSSITNYQNNPLVFNPNGALNGHLPRYTQITPSTIRPNYSHLFSKGTYNRDPETEQFLGQITIQSPANYPIEFRNKKFSSFQPSVPIQSPENSQIAQIPNGVPIPTKAKFQHPVNAEENQAKKAEVLNNSIVLGSASRNSFLNHRTRIIAPTSIEHFESKPAIDDYFVDSNGEVFATKGFTSSSLDTTGSLLDKAKSDEKNKINVVTEETTEKEDDDYHVTTTAEFQNSISQNKRSNKLISKDNDVDDITTEAPTTRNEVVDSSLEDEDYEDEYEDFTDDPAENEDANKDNSISVITTKSFINNTIIGTATANPTTATETSEPTTLAENDENSVTKEPQLANQMLPPNKNGNKENSSDSWVVVASVQTSRSVSGARYLPLPIVEQHEQTTLLGEALGSTSESNNVAQHTTESNIVAQHTTELYEETTVSPTTKLKSSTESLIDKLDRVQSDLSSGLLSRGFKSETNNIAVITEGMLDRIDETTKYELPEQPTTESPKITPAHPAVAIRKFSHHLRPSTTSRSRSLTKSRYQTRKMNVPVNSELPQSDEPSTNGTVGRSSGISNKNQIVLQDSESVKPLDIENLLKKIVFRDSSSFLPSDYKPENSSAQNQPDGENNPGSSSQVNLNNVKGPKENDISGFSSDKKVNNTYQKNSASSINSTDLSSNVKEDISKFLPPGYKTPSNKGNDNVDISKFLPPGYKLPIATTTTAKAIDARLEKPHDLNKKTTASKKINFSSLFSDKEDNIAAFLPPGYKLPSSSKQPVSTTKSPSPTTEKKAGEKKFNLSSLFSDKEDDVSAFLPPGYKLPKSQPVSTTSKSPELATTEKVTTESIVSSTTASSGSKVVFPSRPGGIKKTNRLTTPRSGSVIEKATTAKSGPSILKGWPSRATTEFTGWPTPSTTPISIEKLLEAARAAAISPPTISTTTSASIAVTTPSTTTTTVKPTTPGICKSECDLAGTIKLVGGAKWVPELLDRNTKEWQILANEVQFQLEDVYSKSEMLNKVYKKIRIDGFSEGSVFVDYVVELNNLTKGVNTKEMKSLFNEAILTALKSSHNREAKASDLDGQEVHDGNKLTLGNFVLDPVFTDFIVIPKQISPTVGYAENDVLLPQWAIAIIVIGLASLLFVIIFGVTVLVNKQKNAKKKQPTLTEDMLNELDKNHMGGIDNYAVDDMYNMEDVWGDTTYDVKPSKKRSVTSLNDNNMPNIYDSWKSEWNGYYYNTHYGNQASSSNGGYGRRRSDYDTNF